MGTDLCRYGEQEAGSYGYHPKGPHIHLDDEELPYIFRDLDQLVEDFRNLVTEHLGVEI